MNYKEEYEGIKKQKEQILHCLNNTIDDYRKENKKLKEQLDEALTILAEMYPPCERDGFMDKNTDYCSINCGVDDEIFKKCWLKYINQKRGVDNE